MFVYTLIYFLNINHKCPLGLKDELIRFCRLWTSCSFIQFSCEYNISGTRLMELCHKLFKNWVPKVKVSDYGDIIFISFLWTQDCLEKFSEDVAKAHLASMANWQDSGGQSHCEIVPFWRTPWINFLQIWYKCPLGVTDEPFIISEYSWWCCDIMTLKYSCWIHDHEWMLLWTEMNFASYEEK